MPNYKVELHIFTNSTQHAPGTELVERTYSSFVNAFGTPMKTKVWHDPKPNKRASTEYHQNLEKLFPEVHLSTSLSDGYTRALKEAETEFLFMLEHDWEFVSELINHDIARICTTMKKAGILHFRFNKMSNATGVDDRWLTEQRSGDLAYCVTPYLSNNPHVIQREKYIEEALPHLFVSKHGRKYGIEEALIKAVHLHGAIYGPEGHPPTVKHLDGSGSPKTSRVFSRIRSASNIAPWRAHKFLRSLGLNLE